MITPVPVPKLTISAEEAEVVRWLKNEGELTKEDEPLVELETDKAVVEVSSPVAGYLKRIVVKQGKVAVGKVIAFIGDAADTVPDDSPMSLDMPQTSTLEPVVAPASFDGASKPIGATPAARRRARELGIDLKNIIGKSTAGSIMLEDVEAFLGQAIKPPRTLRDIIAAKTLATWQSVPHIHIGGQLRAGQLRAAWVNAKQKEKITVTDLLLFVLASLLPNYPDLNTVWVNGHATVPAHINLGFAVQTDRGVAVPVIPHAAHRSLSELSAARIRLAQAARSGKLSPEDLADGTFTLTNLGMYPVDFFVPVINHPQSSMLATGRLRELAEIESSGQSSAWYMWVNLAVDHRVADGARGAEFLRDLEAAFESLQINKYPKRER